MFTIIPYFSEDHVRIIAVFIACMMLPLFALGADSPVIYTKTVITIIPASDTAKPAGKDDGKKIEDSKESELMPSIHRVAKEFTVEVRPLAFLQQSDFIAHQPFTDKEGMMFVVDPSGPVSLKSSNLLGKVDVLFVLEDGIIEKIAPELSLRDLAEPLTSEKPIHALVFLGSGMAQSSDIKPGDRIDAAFFKTHPIILQ